MENDIEYSDAASDTFGKLVIEMLGLPENLTKFTITFQRCRPLKIKGTIVSGTIGKPL